MLDQATKTSVTYFINVELVLNSSTCETLLLSFRNLFQNLKSPP
jgi:hypothetical protein